MIEFGSVNCERQSFVVRVWSDGFHVPIHENCLYKPEYDLKPETWFDINLYDFDVSNHLAHQLYREIILEYIGCDIDIPYSF